MQYLAVIANQSGQLDLSRVFHSPNDLGIQQAAGRIERERPSHLQKGTGANVPSETRSELRGMESGEVRLLLLATQIV